MPTEYYNEKRSTSPNVQQIYIYLIYETHLTKQMYIEIRGFPTIHTTHPQRVAREGNAVLI